MRLRSGRTLGRVRRLVGLVFVCLGAAVLSTDGSRWDYKVVSFLGPGSHGLHAFELLGFAVLAAGVIALWTASTQ
jgi:hypothetical protein